MNIFGCHAWVHIPKTFRKKGSPKARKFIFLGYQTGSKIYRFYDQFGNVIISRPANFLENENWSQIHANSEILLPLSRDRQEKFEEGNKENEAVGT